MCSSRMSWYWVKPEYDCLGALLVGQQVLHEGVVRGQRLEAGAVEHPDALCGAHEVALAAVEVLEQQQGQGQELYLVTRAYRLDDFGLGGVEGAGAQRPDGELCLEVPHVVEEQLPGLLRLVCLHEQLRVVESDLLHDVEVLRKGRLHQQQVLLVGPLDEPQRARFVGKAAHIALLLADVHSLHVQQNHAEREDAVSEKQDWLSRAYASAGAGAPRPGRSPRRGPAGSAPETG